MSNTKNYITSPLLAGTIIALLSAIPYLSGLNCCCCLWHIIGGFWAAYLFYSSKKAITIAQGIWTGILAGAWASLIYSLLTAILWRTMSEQFVAQIEMLSSQTSAEVPPEMLDLITELSSSPIVAFFVVLLASIMIFPIVVAIGGIIGAAILRSRKSAQVQ